MTMSSPRPRCRPRPGTPKFEYWYVSSRSRASYADSETPHGTPRSAPYVIWRRTTSRHVWSSRLPAGARITSAGIRYSNIDPDRDIALGDRDKARETSLRSEQVIPTGVETPVGDAVSDRKQFPHRVEEEPEVHGRDHGVHVAGEDREATDQRLGGRSGTPHALDEVGRIGQRRKGGDLPFERHHDVEVARVALDGRAQSVRPGEDG